MPTRVRQAAIFRQLHMQSALGRERSALITDIDNTLYRAGHRAAVAAAWNLRTKAFQAPYPIIAVTGGDYEQLVRGRLESGELPLPEVVVSSVGTEIWFLQDDGSYVKDKVYDRHLQKSGYSHVAVSKAATALLPVARTQAVQIDFQEPDKEAANTTQPDPTYLPYKVSLHFFATDEQVAKVTKIFQQHFSRQKIVVCEEINYNAALAPDALIKKYCLDIMPATKVDAVNYLIKLLGLERGIVAGDSGNDIDMLLDTPLSFAAVAVGGHKAELKAALLAHQATTKNHKQIYIEPNDERLAAQSLLLFDAYLRGATDKLLFI